MTRVFSATVLGTSLLLACGSGSGTSDGGADAGSCPAVTSSGAPDSGFCNGAQLQTDACANVYVATYPESDDVRKGCDGTFDGLSTPGSSLPALGGILDANSYSAQAGLLTLYPSGCEDFGQGRLSAVGGTPITPPSGASTVAAVRTAQAASTVYGIVTYVEGPFYDTTTLAGKDATLYLQDQPGASGPAPLSGIAIYIDDQYTTGTGTNGYPDGGLSRGDVVAISGLTWSDFQGQDQLAWSSSASLTVLGTQPLPAAISLSSADIAGAKGQQYLGMRVTQSDAPDQVVNGCPTLLYSN